MTTLTVYHYSNKSFNEFDISKSDGFWFTDISPNNTEMLEEVGADGSKFCATCEITFDNPLRNGKNFDVQSQLDNSDYDAIKNCYDGFTDYALINNSQIKIVSWSELS